MFVEKYEIDNLNNMLRRKDNLKEKLSIVDSKYDKLSKEQRKIRKWLLEYILNNGQPFNLYKEYKVAAECLGLSDEQF